MGIRFANAVLAGVVPKVLLCPFSKVMVPIAIAAALVLPAVASADVNLVFGIYAADKPTETVKK